MNNPGPKRFSKYRDGVPLQEYLEKIIDLRFATLDKQIEEAKRLMEKTMDGFPGQFLKIGAFEPVQAEIKAISKTLNQMEGKASQRSMVITLAISIISLLLAMMIGVAGLMRHFQY